mmetsp:Transcript_19798/g.52520  ORF Transcript_19798/g.52520 Transcript_19798/m.52520 type:complete len:112 (+) Transcript_19798:221-556(+)
MRSTVLGSKELDLKPFARSNGTLAIACGLTLNGVASCSISRICSNCNRLQPLLIRFSALSVKPSLAWAANRRFSRVRFPEHVQQLRAAGLPIVVGACYIGNQNAQPVCSVH